MYERFTERARQVIVLSQEEARAMDHHYIGTEHILLGLIREEEGLAARVLESLGVTYDKVRPQIPDANRPVDSDARKEAEQEGKIPFSPRARRVLELSLREALSLGHNYIGTEHVLLGLCREMEGNGYRILREQLDEASGASASEKIRNEIIRMLAGPGAGQPKPPHPEPLTEAMIRAAHPNLSQVQVQHKDNQGLYGTLTAYDFFRERCTVKIDMPDVTGEFQAQRQDLVVRRAFTTARLHSTG